MGEVAFVFGWSPETMDRMGLAELMVWRDEAVRIHNRANSTEGKSG